jgi:hypothetical protein
MQVRTRDRGKQLGARYGESHNGAVRGKYPSMDSRLGGDIRGALIPITGTCTADKKKKKEEMMENLILNVEARSAAELIKHSHGPGTRFVFSDHNNNPEGSIYVIMRSVENVDNPEMHIEPHQHDFESLFIFKGYNPDMSGLVVAPDRIPQDHKDSSRIESQLPLYQGFRGILEHRPYPRCEL